MLYMITGLLYFMDYIYQEKGARSTQVWTMHGKSAWLKMGAHWTLDEGNLAYAIKQNFALPMSQCSVEA